MKTQFDLSELPVTIAEIWDENDGEVVLTLVAREGRVSGFLELWVESTDDGIDAGWRWTVNEPAQQECYKGSKQLLMDAAHELKAGMDDMAEFIRERDGR